MERTEKKRIRIRDNEIKAIIFRNFAGAPDKFNLNGCMPNFWIVLEDDRARELEEDRLNIKWKPNRDGDLEARLQIFVRWDKVPPTVFQKIGDDETLLNEDTVSILDYADISHVDLVIAPYDYDPTKPVKSYVSKARFIIESDDWDD